MRAPELGADARRVLLDLSTGVLASRLQTCAMNLEDAGWLWLRSDLHRERHPVDRTRFMKAEVVGQPVLNSHEARMPSGA